MGLSHQTASNPMPKAVFVSAGCGKAKEKQNTKIKTPPAAVCEIQSTDCPQEGFFHIRLFFIHKCCVQAGIFHGGFCQKTSIFCGNHHIIYPEIFPCFQFR